MELTTLQKFLLLAHHPEKGRFIISEIHTNYGIIGAILLEMSLEQKISIGNDKLILKQTGSSGNAIFDEISEIIRNSKKTKKIKYWITRLSRKSRKYKWIALNELANNYLIRIENKKFLGLIPYKKSYLIDKNTRGNLIIKLNKVVLSHKELSNEDAVVLGLIEACKMHKIISSNKEELKIIRKELKKRIKESPIADNLDKTIKEVQAAVIAAVMASTVAAGVASTH